MSNNMQSAYKMSIVIDNKNYIAYNINQAATDCFFDLKKLPYSLRILFENVLRHNSFNHAMLNVFNDWLHNKQPSSEIEFSPSRVLMQDFTGVPAIVDMAAMRDAISIIGGDPDKINPVIPIDLVIDHSVQVDKHATNNAFDENVRIEMQRNIERYKFLKWGQSTFNNFRVVPPGTGICHQVNLEHLAQVVWTEEKNNGDEILAYPDTVIGTDSHTTMINGLSVLGWGVGGIEAEAAMLGEPISMILPEVIGVELKGKLNDFITATDVVLTITQMLRAKGVVGKFVEFFGAGLQNLSLADRATIANMAPEYGSTCGFFPIDEKTIEYLKCTSRDPLQIKLVEHYAKSMNLWYNVHDKPKYTNIITLDLSHVEPSLAGAKRPQDRLNLGAVADNFKNEVIEKDSKKYNVPDVNFNLAHGSIVIAAITSCTNTSNPAVMIAAGLLAKKAYELGFRPKPWVKTSLAPGSQVVMEYFHKSGLDQYLDKMGFNLVGYGCTTCIGNSGPLDGNIEKVITDNKLVVASILSGNRNFEGRVHPLVKANYLASPPLVVAYAIAGHIDIDLTTKPLGIDQNDNVVYLKDIWPSHNEITEYITKYITSEMFKTKYAQIFTGTKAWQDIAINETKTYNWDKNSTYINHPPYFEDVKNPINKLSNIKDARVLAVFGDSITTDHISPAGNIKINSPAGKYLMSRGVDPKDFNSYGARRGNHEVMVRGTFANIRIKNELCPDTEGGITLNYYTKKQDSIYDVAMDYKSHCMPLVIFAGKEYGTGSSRDWAAKGTKLLGVRAVIAESFERIHRSNLVGMGVLPMIFTDGITRHNLGLTGEETISINGLHDEIHPYHRLRCVITQQDAAVRTIDLILQVFTNTEMQYLKQSSILHSVINNLKIID